MSGNLTFSGVVDDPYTAPAGYTKYDSDLRFITTTGISTTSSYGSFTQLVDDATCSGSCSVEASLQYPTSDSEIGLCFVDSARTGFALVITATGFTLRKEVTGGGSTTISSFSRANSGSETIKLYFNVGTGAIDVHATGSSILTGSYTDTLSGLRAGLMTFQGGGSAGYYNSLVTVTSTTGDTTPDSFTFTDVTGAALSTVYTSDTKTVSGIDTPAAISISGGSGTYNINGGSYTASSGTISNGDTFTARVTSSGSNSTAVSTTVTIGGVSDTYTVTTLAAASVDSYPATVRSGSTGNAYTTTGLSAVSGITIGSLAATSISDTSGDGTHSVPSLTDGVAHELYGTKTVTVTGTGGSPTTSTSFQPLSTQSFVTLSGTLNTTDTGVLYNFSPAAAVGDQIVWTTANGTVDAQGNYAGDFEGTQTMWHIDATDNVARSFSVITGVGSNILKYWNGSAWVEKPLKYWNGSAWAAKTLKYWNGSAWV